ncbi:MAG: biotin/lipoyl-binding protein, partial [Isosphaeraceae bacterium]
MNRSGSRLARFLAALNSGLLVLTLGGCERVQPKVVPPPPAKVSVSMPVSDYVTDYEEFPGRTDAVMTVEIRSRVTGYLTKVHFADGDEVEKDTLLFEIDSSPYDAELARSEASVVQSE